jgi:hypothetical protein
MRDDGTSTTLADVLPDPASLSAEEQLVLAADIDVALARLIPRCQASSRLASSRR